MVHRSKVIDSKATAVQNMMVITPEKADQFKNNINEFAIAVSQNSNWQDKVEINKLLKQYKLRGCELSEYYMSPYQEL